MIKNIFHSKSKLSISFFILLFIFIVLFKSSTGNFLNGLPISNKFETLTVLLLIPYIFFFNKTIFVNIFSKILIIFLFFLKIYLISFPDSGILHKQYHFNEDKEKYEYKASYNSFWHKGITVIQQEKWDKRNNFPLDWINFDYELNNKLGLTVENNDDLNTLKLKHYIEFDLLINENSNFGIKADGVQKSDLIIFKNDNERKIIIDAEKLIEKKKTIYLEKGKYTIKGNLYYTGNKWSLIPYINKDNKLIDPFKKNLIFHNTNLSFDLKKQSNLNLFSNIFKIVFIIFILFNIVFDKFELLRNKINVLSLSLILLIFYLISNYLLNIFFYYLDLNIFRNFFPLSLSIFVLSLSILIFNSFNVSYFKIIKIKDFFIIIIPVIFLHWHLIYIEDFYSTSYYTLGDDWIQFQKYSREIVLNGEWLIAGEKVFYFRPALRYFFAVFHIFFGESGYSFKIIEVWTIILSIYFIVKVLELKKFNIRDQIIFCTIIFILFFGEKYATLIGRGISEFYGLFFLNLSIFVIIVSQINFNLKLLLVSFFGIVSAWIREEKILMALSLIFLFYDKNRVNYYSNIYFTFIEVIKIKYLQILIFSLITIIGFPVLFELRNYYIGGDFTFTTHPSVLVINLLSFYKMLFAVEWPNIPRIPGFIIFISFFLIILSCINSRIFKLNENIGYMLIILSIILPSIILEMPGYSPRHTIYLLPLSLLYLFLIKQNYLKSND